MPLLRKSSHLVAILESLLVTLIWASSFVFIKVGLDYLGPLTMAGLRYFGAFVILLPFIVHRSKVTPSISSHMWMRLFLIGLSGYTIGNGALFWGLQYLPATTVSFLMSVNPLLIWFASVLWLQEIPTRWQVVGILISLIGNGLFFATGLGAGEPLGLVIIFIGLLGFASFGILGRAVAREQQVDTLWLTAFPLAMGGSMLLLFALPLEGMPVLTPSGWGIVFWLALVNTALAYMLYNHALRILSALEMNIMLNLAPLGTALLAWLFLAEHLSILQVGGMLTVILGVFLVQQVRESPAKTHAG